MYDSDLLETAEKVLEGIENFVLFKLPLNSSLLNYWSDTPLQMAGIWSPPLRTIPVASGVDVASSLNNEVPSTSINIPKLTPTIDEIYTNSITNSIFQNSPNFLEADEDDKFKKILEASDDESDASESLGIMNDSLEKINDSSEKNLDAGELSANESSPRVNSRMGNSIDRLESWSETPDQNKEQIIEKPKLASELKSTKKDDDQKIVYKRSVRTTPDHYSFKTVWDYTEKKNNSANFKEVWQRFEKTLLLNANRQIEPTNNPQDEDDEDTDFVMIDKPVSEKLNMAELPYLIEVLCKLSTEQGLDSQGFLCKECNSPLGIDFSKAQ